MLNAQAIHLTYKIINYFGKCSEIFTVKLKLKNH